VALAVNRSKKHESEILRIDDVVAALHELLCEVELSEKVVSGYKERVQSILRTQAPPPKTYALRGDENAVLEEAKKIWLSFGRVEL